MSIAFAASFHPDAVRTYVRTQREVELEKQELTAMLEQGWSLERIGNHYDRDPATVSYWMRKHGLSAVHRDRVAARGGLDRGELERAVQAGLTIAEIAEAFGRSKATVRYWLGRYEMRMRNGVGRRPRHDVAAARSAGLDLAPGTCAEHGEVMFVRDSLGTYRCKRCRTKHVTNRRRRVKEILVAEASGACQLCGYNAHPAALEFHHVDPCQKLHGLSVRALSLAALRVEAGKCVLLCSNCHAEVEHGARELPLH